MNIARLLAFAALLCGTFANIDGAAACPFCSAPSLTLSEQAAQSDVVLLARWKSGTKGSVDDQNDASSTVFEVTKVLKGPLQPGDTIKQAGYQPAEKGDAFLLTGLGADVVQWDVPTPFSEKAFDYLAKAPSPKKDDGEKVSYQARLPYFIKHLENEEEAIANDAYYEFANAPYEDIVAVKAELPREKIRGWVLDPNTPPSRLGLYGLLMGLSGTDEDAAAMEQLIAKPTDEFRIGLDGVMSGYLLLKKEPGLELVKTLKLENEYIVGEDGQPIVDDQGQKVAVPFSETYAAMQAVRFMWDYGGGVIAPDQLRAAMRVLLDRPELADLAIADLARWKDWSIMDKLAELYEQEAYQIPGIKRSIIRYFDAATKDLPKDVDPKEDDKMPAHVKEAREHYAAIKKKDPETVKSVEQFLILLQ
ncbi:MAG: hypothetical protein M3552_18960 [Planctomycetota bacterium]|nr:hypothetical protein [Planctomycetaceae bacterium]MDQ3332696.1 hypothetical protein [Planctomycetota bacterium]